MTKRSLFRYFKTSSLIIRLAVMLTIRFPLSLRNVEDLRHLQDRNEYKQIRAAVLAEWRGLLAA